MGKPYKANYRVRRLVASILLAIISVSGAVYFKSQEDLTSNTIKIENKLTNSNIQKNSAAKALNELEVKGRAPKTGYSRDQFGKGWQKDVSGCDTRNQILQRDLKEIKLDTHCKVISGVLDDPYTGKAINFTKGKNSDKVQIDHVVALSNSWQTGAQLLPPEERIRLANDPLNLLAVDGPANQQKGDADAATWLPSNKSYRCAYIARQIAVKKVYHLWVTQSEKTAMERILNSCPNQTLIIENQ